MVAKKWHALSTAGNGKKSRGTFRKELIIIGSFSVSTQIVKECT